MNEQIRIKCVLLGHENSGKTSIVSRYIYNEFEKNIQATIGCAFNLKVFKIENIEVNLELWDTAGSERYKSLLPMYYRNADIILICIDLSINNDKDILDYWVEEIDERVDIKYKTVFVVGTKFDIKNDINQEMIDNFLIKYPEFKYIETSSKDNLNISKLFKDCVNAIINNKIILEDEYNRRGVYSFPEIEKETKCFEPKCYIH